MFCVIEYRYAKRKKADEDETYTTITYNNEVNTRRQCHINAAYGVEILPKRDNDIYEDVQIPDEFIKGGLPNPANEYSNDIGYNTSSKYMDNTNNTSSKKRSDFEELKVTYSNENPKRDFKFENRVYGNTEMSCDNRGFEWSAGDTGSKENANCVDKPGTKPDDGEYYSRVPEDVYEECQLNDDEYYSGEPSDEFDDVIYDADDPTDDVYYSQVPADVYECQQQPDQVYYSEVPQELYNRPETLGITLNYILYNL